MNKEELKKEGKLYANRLFDAEEQAYLYDMVVRVYVESAEPREKQIAELEKENEIFKKENEIIAQQRDDRDADISKLENRIEELKERFRYAKEIIEGLMRFCRCFAQHHTEDIRYKEAEQFLKEE